ncbi:MULTISPECIES: ABC transporter ATP-binding protein [unclassified Lebetimonas]|uniref:ABC transporter ATP-binding protein/permease n=1 Tax=unclassified Lebetimonas TaxID=2648158 RepID=UPI000465DFB4|nr:MULTISPECIES: ABC transporter ATP-binding protein [unclassified Lebetimonas]
MLKKLNFLLTKRDKLFLLFLLLFSIFVSLIETIGIGIIMPFISVASDFKEIHSNKYFEYFYTLFHFKSEINFVVAFGIGLIIFYILRSVINLFYFYLLNRFSFGRYHLVAYRLFENYMGLSYEKFINKNSSLMIKSIINDANNVINIISNFLFMLSEIFVMIFIYAMLVYVNWKMTLLLTLYLLINVAILKIFVTKKIKKAGIERDTFQAKFYEILNSSFGNFKIIKLKTKDKEILDKFSFASFGFANANIKNQTLAQFPRLFLEMVGFSLVAFIIIYLVLKYHTDIRGALPILSIFVLGLYRLLPSVNRVFYSYNQIVFYSKSLDVVHNELIYEPEELGDEKIEFKKEIKLDNVGFSYGEKEVLKDINLVIKKGEKIGIVGESGSGKSTLIDLIIGLYRPKYGKIFIDENLLNEKNIKSWRQKIGYIPQMIYLKDGSVAENVAFLEKIDEQKVKEALRKANILDFLEKHHEGIYTHIGENGIKLSGGQRQRIAIARALYNDPEILVLDEATSALDNETEAKIMDEIYKVGENKTMIIVAHRLSTLDGCDRIIKIVNGEIK